MSSNNKRKIDRLYVTIWSLVIGLNKQTEEHFSAQLQPLSELFSVIRGIPSLPYFYQSQSIFNELEQTIRTAMDGILQVSL